MIREKIKKLLFRAESVKRIIPGYHIIKIKKIIRYLNKTEPLIWPLPELKNKIGIEKYEYSLHSQNGEDGILRYLFSEIGIKSKLFLEFGFEVKENNSLRLVFKEGFEGVFIDGSKVQVKYLNMLVKKFKHFNVKAYQKFLTLENLENTIKSKLPEEVDLLSIDVDGNDYWFWENISYLNPRIVIMEYNASLGPYMSLTVPYDPSFRYKEIHEFYHGASLAALEKLGNKKGYKLIGCDSKGVNAFFIRQDCLTHNIKTMTSEEAFRPCLGRLQKGFSLEEQYNIIKDMPFVKIA